MVNKVGFWRLSHLSFLNSLSFRVLVRGGWLKRMRRETIAIHGGYDGDPTTHAVAVPIYQTVAYEFDSAEHAAALFNLEVDGLSLQQDRKSDRSGAGTSRRRAGGRGRRVVRGFRAGGLA